MTGKKPLALVIDDDDAAGDALSIVVRDWGADVVLCRSAAAAAALGDSAARARWIIADFNLGAGATGVDVARGLADTASSARVLVLTACTGGRAEAAAAAAGFSIMHKPARAEAIHAWLEAA